MRDTSQVLVTGLQCVTKNRSPQPTHCTPTHDVAPFMSKNSALGQSHLQEEAVYLTLMLVQMMTNISILCFKSVNRDLSDIF